jgi:hypothetical protein
MTACELNFNVVWHSQFALRQLFHENEEVAFECFKVAWNLAIDAATESQNPKELLCP